MSSHVETAAKAQVSEEQAQLDLGVNESGTVCLMLEIIWRSEKPKIERYDDEVTARAMQKEYERYDSVLKCNLYKAEVTA